MRVGSSWTQHPQKMSKRKRRERDNILKKKSGGKGAVARQRTDKNFEQNGEGTKKEKHHHAHWTLM